MEVFACDCRRATDEINERDVQSTKIERGEKGGRCFLSTGMFSSLRQAVVVQKKARGDDSCHGYEKSQATIPVTDQFSRHSREPGTLSVFLMADVYRRLLYP